MRHPPPTRWEQCSHCREIFPPLRLVHISEIIPERKRGWLCYVFGDDTLMGCAAKLGGRRAS